MTGRIAVTMILGAALILGAAMYYLQVYHFYEEIPAEDGNVQLVSVAVGEPEPVMFENFKGIDATSSPIRYRACFDLAMSIATLTETYAVHPAPEPLVAPGWFDCFDAEAVGAALETGEAVAFLSSENTPYGIDRVVAVFADNSAVAWDQINRCGEVVFDGDPAPEGCPPAPEDVR